MVEERELHVGERIVFTDADCRDHNALVTVVWSQPKDNGCCNLVYVSGDESKTDPYGRQIERATSVVHKDHNGGTPGYCWRFPDEEKPVYREPAEK
jgi:hypothetical protein